MIWAPVQGAASAGCGATTPMRKTARMSGVKTDARVLAIVHHLSSPMTKVVLQEGDFIHGNLTTTVRRQSVHTKSTGGGRGSGANRYIGRRDRAGNLPSSTPEVFHRRAWAVSPPLGLRGARRSACWRRSP